MNEHEKNESTGAPAETAPLAETAPETAAGDAAAESRSEREKFTAELAEYDRLMELLSGTDGLGPDTESSKISVAFLLEEMKQADPEKWPENAERLRREISAEVEARGAAAASWLVNERVGDAYRAALDRRIAGTGEAVMKAKLEMMKKLYGQLNGFKSLRQAKGAPISYGGISTDFMPEWFRHTK